MITLIILTVVWCVAAFSLAWDWLFLLLPRRRRIAMIIMNIALIVYITVYGFFVGRAWQYEQDSQKEKSAVIQQAPVDKQLVEKDSTKLLVK